MRRREGESVKRARGNWNRKLRPDVSDVLFLYSGQRFSIYVREDWRDAKVLAVIGPEALIEYVMPSGRSALRLVPKNYRNGIDPGRPYKNVSYHTLAKHWLLTIARNDLNWWGSPQQAKDVGMSPRALFLSRWPEEEYRLYLPMEGPTPAQMQAQTRATNRIRARL